MAALKLLNKKVATALNDIPRADLDTADYKKGMELLSSILDGEVRRLKAKQGAHEKEKKKKAKGTLAVDE